MKDGVAVFHRFKGKKIKDIKKYIPTHFEDGEPVEAVIVAAGGNDIPTGKVAANFSAMSVVKRIVNFASKSVVELLVAVKQPSNSIICPL